MSETGNSRMFRKNDVTLAAKSSSNLSSEAIDNCNGDNNDLVAMFQCGDNNRQMIQLTPAQAAALGLTFEEDSEEPYDEVKYSNNNQDLIANLRDNLESNEPRGSNFWNSQSEEWQVLGSPEEDLQGENGDDPSPSSDFENSLETDTFVDNPVNDRLFRTPPKIRKTVANTIRSNNSPQINESQPTQVILENFVQNNVQQPQIIQGMPMILPTSHQFILTPVQTVVKQPKNVKILPNLKQVVSKQRSNTRSLLLPTSILQSSLVKTVVTPQIINPSEIQGQLINTPRLTIACNPAVPQMPTNLVNVSAMTTQSPKSLLNVQTLTKVAKPRVPSIISSARNAMPLKNGSSILKPVQIAPARSVESTKVVNRPILLKPPIIRTQKILPKNPVKTTTATSAPVSILKPKSNVILKNSIEQNVTDSQSDNVSSTSGKQTVQNSFVKLADNSATVKNKPDGGAEQAAKLLSKKPKSPDMQTDSAKPLGSTENPIQIIQQGQTFHSMHKLSQMQLKQIANILQQRNQQTQASNEKIVYRVVFPEEFDLKSKKSSENVVKTSVKRGRPKKNSIRPAPPVSTPKPVIVPEQPPDEKDDRKKAVARTRSGRLSRPPRHMVRDYKHLHHSDFMQPDLDDSDGGYSEYNTKTDKVEDGELETELLPGVELPKRKVSDHFRCPTCNKVYLGRTRMIRHYEMHPDHGSPDQLPPVNIDSELKILDSFKRKGKKRGPWAYITPEAKSERRQVKLKEAISVCESQEIINIAAKPVLNAQSLFDLLVIKSNNNVRNLLGELKDFMEKIRERVGGMLSVASDEDKLTSDMIDLNEDLLCDALGLNPGLYRIGSQVLRNFNEPIDPTEGPQSKRQKVDKAVEDSKENLEERLSSGFSESSDVSVSDFLHDRKSLAANSGCPEVLSALTLMPKNPRANGAPDFERTESMSKLLISPPSISPNSTDANDYEASSNVNLKLPSIECVKDEMSWSRDGMEDLQKNSGVKNNKAMDSSSVSKLLISNPEIQNRLAENKGFQKININNSYPKLGTFKNSFQKLSEASSRGFATSEDTLMDEPYKEEYEEVVENFEGDTSRNYPKRFPQKLLSKTSDLSSQVSVANNDTSKILSKLTESLPILQDPVPSINSNSSDTMFSGAENLDISKMDNYDHMAHLDILGPSGVIDEQLHLDDQTLVDELVSERLKNIIPDNLISSSGNLESELDFEALGVTFCQNSRS